MVQKEESPIKLLVKDCDALKKKVDSTVKQGNTILKSKSKNEKVVADTFKRATSIQKEVNKLMQHVKSLKQENEKIKVNRWTEKRDDEVKRLQKMKDQISDVINRMKPHVPESDSEEEASEDVTDSDEGTVTGEDDTVSEEDEVTDTEGETEEETGEDEVDGGMGAAAARGGQSSRSGTSKASTSSSKSKKEQKKKMAVPTVHVTKPTKSDMYDDDDDDDDGETGESTESEEESDAQSGVKQASEVSQSLEETSEEESETEGETETETETGAETGADTGVESETEGETDEETETDAESETETEVTETETDGETETEEGSETESGSEEETDDEIEDGGTMRVYQAISDYDGQQAQDLSFKTGDILTVIQARESGWFEAENADGIRGEVPSNFLQVYTKRFQESSEESDSEEEDEPEQKTPRSGRMLWGNIRKAVKETSVTDVLHAMGAVPAGFRESTLAKMAAQDIYTMKNYLHPKLSASCLSYKDLFYDDELERIRARNVRLQRVITLVNCRQIPLPGTGVEILSRHVRICLFDGKNVLSNIHVVRVQSVDKDQHQWTFNTKLSDAMKSLQFGECFIRSNSSEGNIGILFELCMSYKRTNTSEQSEFSCGWVHLPLIDQTGFPTPNKSHDLFVHGGTPYEKGVDVDPSIGKKGNTSKIRTLMAGNKQPRMTVKLAAPSKDQKDLLDTLPDVLIGNTCHLFYLSMYRQIMVDTLIRDCVDPQSIEPIYSPMLCSFPIVAEQPDIMDILRQAWIKRLKMPKKRSEKRDAESMKEMLQQVYLEHAYPLYTSACIPAYKLGYRDIEKERLSELKRLTSLDGARNSVASLLSSDAVHKAFDISEVSFNIVNSYCVVK